MLKPQIPWDRDRAADAQRHVDQMLFPGGIPVEEQADRKCAHLFEGSRGGGQHRLEIDGDVVVVEREWVGRDKVFILIVLLVIVPFESVAIPLMALMQGQRDTLFVQMIPFVANAFSVFLFYTFFLNVPKSIEEAARLDGLGSWSTFARIVVPNAKPVFATVAILTFLSSWGQFLWPSLVTSDPAARPLPLEMGVFSAQTPPDWGQVFAFGTLLVLPVLVVFLIFQRYFVQSVAGSAVKG